MYCFRGFLCCSRGSGSSVVGWIVCSCAGERCMRNGHSAAEVITKDRMPLR